MAQNGEEKLLAMARHIAKTLGHNDATAEDILQIFSTFDGRFSRDKMADEPGRDRDDPAAQFELTLTSLHRQISQYLAVDHPIWADLADSAAFLDAVDELTAAIRFWTPMATDKGIRACLARADDLMQQTMFRVVEEFRTLMERGGEAYDSSLSVNYAFDSDEDDGGVGDEGDENCVPIAHPIISYDIIIDALPSGTINDLHEIAKRMVAARYAKECSHVFSSCRREFLEESFSRLGLQKLSSEEVQGVSWAELDEEIERWVKGATLALKVLFPSERRLCDRVFAGAQLASTADLAFMEVCRGATIQILNFADAVGIRSRAPERLFKVLDLFETLRDLMPDFEAQFSDQYSAPLRNEAAVVVKRLGEAIRGIFMELENLIRRDPANTPFPGGGVHPITRYVMNYLRAAFRSRDTLEQVFEGSAVEYRKSDERTLPASLVVQIDWIMELLESNLEAKSKVYRVPALCSLFMMNNGRYIVQKMKDSELGAILGDEWIRKQSAKVRQYLANYHRNSWSKVLGALKLEAGTVTAVSMKEKLKLFNMHLEEILKVQSTWIFFDQRVQEDLKASVVESYRNFIGQFLRLPELGRQPNKLVSYSVEDVEAMMNQLFRGSQSGGSGGARK
uniref:Exocyst subunit Exo70 family protein n=1 Tax=Kalanchoe fedtschenkoi TaxID=63787 RepID=A0A7N1A9F7_KALFE